MHFHYSLGIYGQGRNHPKVWSMHQTRSISNIGPRLRITLGPNQITVTTILNYTDHRGLDGPAWTVGLNWWGPDFLVRPYFFFTHQILVTKNDPFFGSSFNRVPTKIENTTEKFPMNLHRKLHRWVIGDDVTIRSCRPWLWIFQILNCLYNEQVSNELISLFSVFGKFILNNLEK